MEQVSDDDLIRMYRNGDAEAFDTLFDRYSTPVYSFARTILGDHRGPEEVLQETFLAVARAAKDYVPRGRFRAWLMRIVRNRCLNHLQARRVRRAVLGAGEVGLDQAASDEPSPIGRAAANERTDAIRAAVAKLPDRQREAIALYAFELAGQVRVRRERLVEWVQQRERDYAHQTAASWAARATTRSERGVA